MTFDRAETIAASSGAEICLRHAAAEGKPRGLIMVSHGLAEHSGRYREFAAFLSARGYHAYAHDHRGHGNTKAKDAPLGRFGWRNGGSLATSDLVEIATQIRARHPNLPLILFGHSLGAALALGAVEHEPALFSGLAMWNCKLNPGASGHAGQFLLKLERMFKGSDVPSDIAPRLTFQAWNREIGESRTGFDWLSSDPDAVDLYISDPLCGFSPSVSMWIDILRLTFDVASRAKLAKLPSKLPVSLAGGGRDPVTSGGKDMEWLGERLRTAGKNDVTSVIYRDMRHETLHELGRQTAMADFVRWSDAIAAKAGRQS